MLNRCKFLLVFLSILLSTINSNGQPALNFEFFDSQRDAYTVKSFTEKWDKDLKSKLDYFFLLVESPTGKNSNYVLQAKTLNKMSSKFEDLQVILIDGCQKDCPGQSGYKLNFEKSGKSKAFRISIFTSRNSKIVSSAQPLSESEIVKKIKDWR